MCSRELTKLWYVDELGTLCGGDWPRRIMLTDLGTSVMWGTSAIPTLPHSRNLSRFQKISTRYLSFFLSTKCDTSLVSHETLSPLHAKWLSFATPSCDLCEGQLDRTSRRLAYTPRGFRCRSRRRGLHPSVSVAHSSIGYNLICLSTAGERQVES